MHPTKTRILEAAERLFARNGYAATSLRDITDAAGANIAAVNYHFGSKEALLVELLDLNIGPISRRRLELLDAAGDDPELVEILDAFLRPPLETIADLRGRDPELPRFVSRMYTEGTDLMNEVMGRQFTEAQERFVRALVERLPTLDPDEILWRLRCVVGIIIYLFADPFGDHAMTTGDPDLDVQRLLTVTLPMVTAHEGVVT